MALAALGTVAAAIGGCSGPQSALAPAGRDAVRIAELTVGMAVGAAVVWALVVGLSLFALLFPRRRFDRAPTRLFIVGGGAVVPTVVLTFLLVLGLGRLPELLEPGDADAPRIEVSGERWWWRVTYALPDGTRFESANEVRLPLGARTGLTLVTPDVIHSFWVPSLAGKVDMIPGRVNRMALEPLRPGVYRGACAEYCGASHAKMSLHAVVLERRDFDAWAAHEASDAAPPAGEAARRGGALFASLGCGACHAVRGTEARGVLGPDLTHVGGRVALAAGVLPNDVEAFARWLARPEHVKPEVRMPGFGMLGADQLRALATYLEGLR